MSLDNGTFIIKIKMGSSNNDHHYCVSRIHACRNIFKNYCALHDTLTASEKFGNLNEASEHAKKLEQEARSEYGQCFVDEFEDNTLEDIQRLRKMQQDDLRAIF